MTDAPKTATAIMMLDMEGRRLEMRDRQIAMAVASKVVEERFDPAAIDDMRDVRRQLIDVAEFAAYEAIQKERELHIGDMQALRAMSEVRWAELMMKPPAIAMETGTAIDAKGGVVAKP